MSVPQLCATREGTTICTSKKQRRRAPLPPRKADLDTEDRDVDFLAEHLDEPGMRSEPARRRSPLRVRRA